MKYTTEIVVDIPREEFINKMGDPKNLKHWQRGLISYELLSKNPGQEGAQIQLVYKMDKRKIVMVETIFKSNLPEEMNSSYDTKGVQNIQKNYFKDEEGKTRWISESGIQFSGFGMKLMGLIMPGTFKKQSLKYMKDFKAFAEDGISVTNL